VTRLKPTRPTHVGFALTAFVHPSVDFRAAEIARKNLTDLCWILNSGNQTERLLVDFIGHVIMAKLEQLLGFAIAYSVGLIRRKD